MRNKGTYSYSANLEVKKRAPLDSKQLTGLKSDLISSSTWQDSDGLEFVYPGMIVSVSGDGLNDGVYRLKNSGYTDINNWELLGSNVDLSNYYTSGQTDTILLGKSDTGHTHNNYESGITNLNSSLSTEISNRISEDTSLSTVIDTKATSTALSTEISNRISGDTSLSTVINTKATSTALSTEISNRISGDTSLSISVNKKLDKTSRNGSGFFTIDDGWISMYHNTGNIDVSGEVYITNNNVYMKAHSGLTYNTFVMSPSDIVVTKQIKYIGVLPSSYGNETLIDKGYLLNQISGFTTGSTYNDSELRTELSGETSTRISEDSSLSSIISSSDSSLSSQIVSSDNSLSSIISSSDSSLSSQIVSSDNSLSFTMSQAISNYVPTKISGAGAQIECVGGLNQTTNKLRYLGDYTFSENEDLVTVRYVTTTVSTSISTEGSLRLSNDESLSTLISTEMSTRASEDLSLSTAVGGGVSSETSNRISVDESLSTSISTETSNVTSLSTGLSTTLSKDTSLSTGLSTETFTRSSTDILLSTTISFEISTRASTDLSLSSAINGVGGPSLSSALSTESSLRGSTDTSLSGAISTHITGDTSSHQSLSTQISTHITGDTSSHQSLSTQISTEMSTRASEDLSLSTAVGGGVSSESSNRISVDESLSTSISTETSTRTSEDSKKVNIDGSLNRTHITNSNSGIDLRYQTGTTYTGINILSGGVYLGSSGDTANNQVQIFDGLTLTFKPIKYMTDVSADYDDRTLIDKGYLSTNISVETSTRISKDSSLSSIISTEMSTRASEDLSLSTAVGGGVSSETSNRISVDESLSTQISTHITGDTSSHQSLSTQISTETSSRISVDNSLSTALSISLTGDTDSSLSTIISTETSTRVSKDNSLSSSISTSNVDCLSRDNSLSTAITSISVPMPYSGMSYNVVTGATITTTGTTTINFNTTDMYVVDISGNTTTGITFDFSNGISGKTLLMVVTNSGTGNTTKCVFNATTCKTFGAYDNTKTNAISVICIRGTNPRFWVTIASV